MPLLEKTITMMTIVSGVLTTYCLFIKIAFGKHFHYLTTKKEEMSAEETMMMRDGSYVVLPQKKYQKLYNRQYTELLALKKKVDPRRKTGNLPRGNVKKALSSHIPGHPKE